MSDFWRTRHGGTRFGLASRALALAALGLVGFGSAAAPAAELVMFAPRGACAPCAGFERDIGESYAGSALGRALPLRKVEAEAERPADLRSIANIRQMPTFVVVDQGSEIGRIVGYPGEATFLKLLTDLADRVAAKPAAGGEAAEADFEPPEEE